MRFTRRGFGTGLLGIGLGLAGAAPALAERPTAARLAEALNRQLAANPWGARFGVSELSVTHGAAAVRMGAHVRLDWAPGLRTRQVDAEGADEAAAWAALLEASGAAFAGVVPGFDATPPAA